MKNELDLFKETWERETAKTIKLLDTRALLRKSAREHDSVDAPRHRVGARDGCVVRRRNDAHSDGPSHHRPRNCRHFRPRNSLLGDDFAGARETNASSASTFSVDRSGAPGLRQGDLFRNPRGPDGTGQPMDGTPYCIQRNILVALRATV